MVINMIFLKKIILENFQSHEYSVIDFDQGLNVIVGQSDSGKTAIIRGIKWALYNEPSGDYFIRQGETYCSVTLEFSNAVTLKRYRGKSKNYYLLTDEDGIEIKYEGFGVGVPEEISEKIGIGKISLDSSDLSGINLGEQLDGAFLLSKKNSVKASAIGRLIGVNLIDDALKVGLTDLRNSKNKKSASESNLKCLKEDLKKYEYLDDLNLRLNKLLLIKNNIKSLDEKTKKLMDINLKLNAIKSEKINTEKILFKTQELNKLEYKLDNLNSLIFSYKELYSKNIAFKNISLGISENTNLMKLLAKIQDIDALLFKIDLLRDTHKKLKLIKIKLEEVLKSKTEEINILSLLENINDVEKYNIHLEEKALNLYKLVDYKEKKFTLENRINKGQSYLNKFKKIEDIDLIYENLKYKTIKHDKLSITLNNLKDIKQKIILEKNTLEENELSIEKNKLLYKNTLGKMEKCPVCYSDIDEEKIRKIIANT